MTDQHSDETHLAETQGNSENTCSKPGQLLKNAREAKGLSPAEVARKLNFLPHYIPALENDDYSQLHSTTFIKGYLRAYARFLNLDPEVILQSFTTHYPQMEQPEKIRPVESLKPEKNGSLVFKFFSLLIVLALVTIIILWWQSRHTETLPDVGNNPVQVETLDGNTIIAPTTQPEPEPEPVEPLASEAPEAPAQEVTTAPVAIPVAQEPAVQPNAPAASNNAPAPAAVPQFTGDPASATLGNGRLVAVQFSADCWLEVRDSTDRVLQANLMRAGDAVLLEGQPPFRMVFGYGPAAEVYYRGERFDFSSRIRSNGYAAIQVQ